MNMNSLIWTVMWAAIFASANACGVEAWNASKQPELGQALDNAPALAAESLCKPSLGVNTWEHWLVPNPDGKTWDVVQFYFKEYSGPTQMYVIDLGTGEVKKHRWPDNICAFLSGRALAFDGKYYIAAPLAYAAPVEQQGMNMIVYDPATNTGENLGVFIHGFGREVHPLALGPDGMLYGSGSWGTKVGLYVYDPKQRKLVKDFGPVGPNHPKGAWNNYTMAADDTHAYIASGMEPAWYVVAVNLKTGEEKVLVESPTDMWPAIIQEFPGAWAKVPQADGSPAKEYWLYHGEATAKQGPPPWPAQASPMDMAGPKPEVYYGQSTPDANGNAVIWYRSAEDAAKAPTNPPPNMTAEELRWKPVRLTGVESYPNRVGPLTLLPNGKLFGSGGYIGNFLYDPKTDQSTLLGQNQPIDPWAYVVHDGKFYTSGYPGGPLFVYDPQLPWTAYAPVPPAPKSKALTNPVMLGEFSKTTRVAVIHNGAAAADGRVYFGGFGKRSYTGGAFGWYDPKTREMGGFWEPLSGYPVYWLAPVQGGNLIIISTATGPDERNENKVPPEAKLFVYDVKQGKIVREFVPNAGTRTTGLVKEVAPGRLLGLTTEKESGRGLLYGLDLSTGKVLFRKPLPYRVGQDPEWPHWVDCASENIAFVPGPDGCLWTWLQDVLVRIDPEDATVRVVGRIDQIGMPTFVGNDLYVSGMQQVRRIRNIVPK